VVSQQAKAEALLKVKALSGVTAESGAQTRRPERFLDLNDGNGVGDLC